MCIRGKNTKFQVPNSKQGKSIQVVPIPNLELTHPESRNNKYHFRNFTEFKIISAA